MDISSRVAVALLPLRLGVFIVMLMWTLDKFFDPTHAALVYENFYFLGGLSQGVLFVIGAIELIIVLAFVVGYRKQLSYGAVFILHAISTLSSYQQYLEPFNNLLFWAAWPMLAACFALYYLRDLDTKWVIR